MTKEDWKTELQGTWTSAGRAAHWAIVKKREISLTEFMGYSSHAFRININGDNVDVAGPTGYEWEDILPKGLLNLGFRCKWLRTPNFTPPTPEMLTEALEMIQDSIDRGIPAVGWDLLIPEFGIIYGYDDGESVLHVKDPRGDGKLPYEKLGRGQATETFVLTLTDSFDISKELMLSGALDMIIDHARRRQHKYELPKYENGLKAYDAWIQAFTNRTVDAFGNSYNTSVVYDARKHAYRFLRGLAMDWNGVSTLAKEVRKRAECAAEHYAKVEQSLAALNEMFPFPDGGTPNDPVHAERAITQLNAAKAAEEKGLLELEAMRELLSAKLMG